MLKMSAQNMQFWQMYKHFSRGMGWKLRVGKAYKVHNNQDTLWDTKCWKLRVGKAYKVHNNQDTVGQKVLEIEGWKGIQSSQQLGHYVGQKVAEI